MKKAGKDGMDTLQTMQKSGIYQDRVDGKLPMDRVKGHYAQARLAQDASFKNRKGQTITKYTTEAGGSIYRVKGTQGEIGDAKESDFNKAKEYQTFNANIKSDAIETAALEKAKATAKDIRIKNTADAAKKRRDEVALAKAQKK